MDRESLQKDGLLERYLLGLTSREETHDIEAYLQTDPQARAELEHLRGQLGIYLDDRGMGEKESASAPNDAAIADDQEVLQYLLHRNQRLNILRYVLLALCVISMGTAVYFYRSSKKLQAELLSEKAHHVQDKHRYKDALQEMDRQTVHLDSMQNIVTETGAGHIQLHYLLEDSIVLIDLSHLSVPEDGFAYHLYTGGAHGGEASYVVSTDMVHALFPLERKHGKLEVFYGPTQHSGRDLPEQPVLVTQLNLESTIASGTE